VIERRKEIRLERCRSVEEKIKKRERLENLERGEGKIGKTRGKV